MNEVRVLGKVYKIERGQNSAGLGGMQVFGTCDYAKSLICIDSTQDPQQERDTVMHEIVHAIDFAMHLEMDERQVHALGAGLAALFADNPTLPFWLAGHQVEIIQEEAPKPKKKPAPKKKAATRRT